MSMDEKTFHARADECLNSLFDKIESQLGDHADVDWQEGILSVEWDSGETYVINKHVPNRQIWMSSPLSGAGHYNWDAQTSSWCNTRDRGDLLENLEKEMSSLSASKLVLR